MNRDPLHRIGDKETRDKPASLRREPRRNLVISSENLGVHLHKVLILERKESGEKHIKNNATRPKISFSPIVTPPAEDLRRDVRRRATLRVQQTIVAELLGESRETEIGDLEIAIVVEKKVLRFEIAVGDATRMAEVDGGEELAEVPASFGFRKTALGDAGEEFAGAGEFKNEEDAGAGGEDFFQFYNVGVAD